MTQRYKVHFTERPDNPGAVPTTGPTLCGARKRGFGSHPVVTATESRVDCQKCLHLLAKQFAAALHARPTWSH